MYLNIHGFSSSSFVKMFFLVACLSLLIGSGAEGRSVMDTGRDLWKGIQEVLPEEYVEVAERQGLNSSESFQQTVLQLAYAQVLKETEALAARQHILEEYLDCSCPRCPDLDDPKNRSMRALSFSPWSVLSSFLQPCETEMAMETIRLLKLSLSESQLSYQRNVVRVACNCPDADRCKGILDPLVFSVLSGQNDTEMNKIYWQNSLKDFPQIMERGLADRLSDAAASILGYAINSMRPQTTSTAAPINTPEVPSPSPSPYSIFAPGQDPTSWQEFPVRNGCPSIYVNISNRNVSGSASSADNL